VKRRSDMRVPVVAFTVLAIALIGLLLAGRSPTGDNPSDKLPAGGKIAPEVHADFTLGVAALQLGDPAAAVAALTRFSRRAPHVPEAHVNLGYAYIELDRPNQAEESFLLAVKLNPEQGNAYYGLGLVHETMGNLEQARSAMRTFIQLSNPSDPHVRKARSALWEWEQASGEAATGGDENGSRRRSEPDVQPPGM